MFESPWPVVLASASPRRQELLRELISSFEIAVADVDEDAETVADPFETATKLARLKARSVARSRPDALVIGGDTVVAVPQAPGEFGQLAKPDDVVDAIRMLSLLSGRTHLVITGVALVWPGGEAVESCESKVTFRKLEVQEIGDYVATGEPMDKAGAYAVQAGGGTFVESIDGSRSNVIGLPLELLDLMLARLYSSKGGSES